MTRSIFRRRVQKQFILLAEQSPDHSSRGAEGIKFYANITQNT